MPTYEYRCRSCGEHLEVVQSFRDEPLTECPSCGGELRKVFGSIGITFKGSGFYKTDSRAGSRSGSGSGSGDGDSSSKSDSSKSDSSKSDSSKSDSSKSGSSASGSSSGDGGAAKPA